MTKKKNIQAPKGRAKALADPKNSTRPSDVEDSPDDLQDSQDSTEVLDSQDITDEAELELDQEDEELSDSEDEHATTNLPLPAMESRAAVRDPLSLYLREIGAFPLLQNNEEFDLARRVRDHQDQEAAFRLVTSHLRLVVKIAMDFQRRWMQNLLDLIQEGNVGLMRAVQKFDPEKGIKFSYYAAFWIKAYILKFIMDNWRLVKIGTTQAQRKLFYNLNKERQRLISQGFDPDSKTISENLNVPVEQVMEMEQRLGSGDMSLDMNVGEDSNATRMDFLPALGPGIEETLATDEISRVLHDKIDDLVPELSEKEVDILRNRLLSDQPITLREIGEKYGITRERVRQLEARLLQKIRTRLSADISDFSREWISDDE